MSDADLLRRAEAKVREVAEEATEGPWTVPAEGDEFAAPYDVVSSGEPGSRFIVCERAGIDAAHIALWSPPVALAVADLLAQHALVHDSYDCLHDPCAALALARRILGEES